MSQFFRRLSVVPFEAAIGAIAFYSGLAGLLGFSRSSDALALLLPEWAVVAFQVAYMASGLALLYGTGRGRAPAEVFGLIVIGASLLVRTVALFWFLGWDVVSFNAVIPNGLFLFACISRYRSLTKGVTLIRTEPA